MKNPFNFFKAPEDTYLQCPVCKCTDFHGGPSGGTGGNVKCANCKTIFYEGLQQKLQIVELGEVAEEAGFELGQKFENCSIPVSEVDEEESMLD